MSLEYEVHTKCPITGNPVTTGYVVKNATFAPDEKPYGVFNCPSCHSSHTWSYENAQIHPVAR